MSAAKRIAMQDDERRILRFMGVIDLVVPKSRLIWHGVDIDVQGVEAACLYGYLDPNGSEVAYILVGDVSGDPTEPLIIPISDDEKSDLNVRIEDGTRDFCHEQGFKFVRWMNCELNNFNGLHILVSAYIVEIEGIGEQQRITARFQKDGRKWFIETAFSIELADELAKPMFLALHPVNIVDNSKSRLM